MPRDNIIALATGKKPPPGLSYVRLLRDADGTERRVRIDLDRPRPTVRYDPNTDRLTP